MSSFKDVLNDIDKSEIKAVPIITEVKNINIPCTDATIEEAEKIWPVLEASLDSRLGHGLAAIQIGIPKKVAIIRYNNETIRLLNTKIVSTESPMVIWGEGCLSLPNKIVNTNRFKQITIQDDIMGKAVIEMSSGGLLPIIIQHEVDHFEGKTILDRQLKPVRKEKIGRNDPCPCNSGKKYKKCCLNK